MYENLQNIKSKAWNNYKKMGGTQTIMERMEIDMLKCHGRVLRMRDNRWPKGVLTWSLEGRKQEHPKGSGKA